MRGVEQRAPPIFGRAAITLGIGPHSSYVCKKFYGAPLRFAGVIREKPILSKYIITAYNDNEFIDTFRFYKSAVHCSDGWRTAD